MKLKHTLLSVSFALILSACGHTTSSSGLPSLTPSDLNTAQTDELELTQSFTGKNFITDGIGEVTLRSTTDGDTARFNVGNLNIAVRFLGVNTPESTGKIQPWGNAASAFTASKLTTASRIVLVNDPSLFGVTDSAGSRYLGFVWYQPASGGDFRLLNLELVDQAYSEALLFEESEKVPYLNAFQAAGAYASRTNGRIYGFRNDPSFDYSDSVYDVSIRFVRKAYGTTLPLEDKYGDVVLDDDGQEIPFTLTNSTKLRFQVVVVATIGSNAILRDVYHPDNDGQYASIFVYTQFNDLPFNQPGDIIQLYAKATTFNDNVQLTDPIMQTFHPFYPISLITRPTANDYDEVVANLGMEGDSSPYDLTNKVIEFPNSFMPYNGFFVRTRITIRARPINPDDDLSGDVTVGEFHRKDANNNMTLYAYYVGTEVSFNLRVDGRMFPYVSHTAFTLGGSYEVSGYVAPYFDNFQLQLNNGVSIIPLDA